MSRMVDKSCVLTILSQEVWEKVRMEREVGGGGEGKRERERERRGRGRMRMNFNFIQLGDAHKNLDGRLECCSYKVITQ